MQVYLANLQALSLMTYSRWVAQYENGLNQMWSNFMTFMGDAAAGEGLLNDVTNFSSIFNEQMAEFSKNKKNENNADNADEPTLSLADRRKVVRLIRLRNRAIAKNRIDGMIGDAVFDEYRQYVQYLKGGYRLTPSESLAIRRLAVDVLQEKYPQLNVRGYIYPETNKRSNPAILTQSLPEKKDSALKGRALQALRPSKTATPVQGVMNQLTTTDVFTALNKTFSQRARAFLRRMPTNETVYAINNEIDVFAKKLNDEIASAYATKDASTMELNDQLKQAFFDFKRQLLERYSLDKIKRLMIKQNDTYLMTPEAASYLMKNFLYIEPRHSIYGTETYGQDARVNRWIKKGYRQGLKESELQELYQRIQELLQDEAFVRRVIPSLAEKRVVDFEVRSLQRVDKFIKDSKRHQFFIRLATIGSLSQIQELLSRSGNSADRKEVLNIGKEVIKLINQSSFDPRVCSVCRSLHGTVYNSTSLLMIPNLLPPSHPYCRCMVIPIPDLDLGRFLFDKLKKRVAKIEKRPTIRNLLATVSGVSFAALWQTIQGAEQPSNMLKDFLGNLKNPVNLLGLVGAFLVGQKVASKVLIPLGKQTLSGAKAKASLAAFLDSSKRLVDVPLQGAADDIFKRVLDDRISSVFSKDAQDIYALLKLRRFQVLSRLAQRDISEVRSFMLRQSVTADELRSALGKYKRIRLTMNATNITRIADSKTVYEFLDRVAKDDMQKVSELMGALLEEDSLDLMCRSLVSGRRFEEFVQTIRITDAADLSPAQVKRAVSELRNQVKWMNGNEIKQFSESERQLMDFLNRNGFGRLESFQELSLLRREIESRGLVGGLRENLLNVVRKVEGDLRNQSRQAVADAFDVLGIDDERMKLIYKPTNALNSVIKLRAALVSGNFNNVKKALEALDGIEIENAYLYSRYKESLSLQFEFLTKQIQALDDEDGFLFKLLASNQRESVAGDIALWFSTVMEREEAFNYFNEEISNYIRRRPITGQEVII